MIAEPLRSQPTMPAASPTRDQRCFTIVSEGRIFGLPVERIQTVFEIMTVTPVPLAPYAILGLVNLRGKIATAISLRRRLRADPTASETSRLAVGLEHHGETFAVIVDEVGDVLPLERKDEIDLPPHLGAEGVKFASIHRLDDLILPMLDLDWVLSFEGTNG